MAVGDARLAPVVDTVRRAAAGQQREVLGEFLDFAGGDDPLLAWVGAAAALPAMWWLGFAGEASDMVERIVLRFGSLSESAELPARVPFDTAVAAGALYDGTPGSDRMAAMIERLPNGNVLAGRLQYKIDRMATDGPTALMPGPALEEPEPMFDHVEALVGRDPGSLSADQGVLLWREAAACSRADVLLRLHDAGLPVVPEVPVMYPLADALRVAGRPAEGERVLLDARPFWRPLDAWDTLPVTPPLNPRLRPLVTERVRDNYLSEPVAEGWW